MDTPFRRVPSGEAIEVIEVLEDWTSGETPTLHSMTVRVRGSRLPARGGLALNVPGHGRMSVERGWRLVSGPFEMGADEMVCRVEATAEQ